MTNTEISRLIKSHKRNSRCTLLGGRRVKAWRVPGTAEHGQLCMYRRLMSDCIANDARV